MRFLAEETGRPEPSDSGRQGVFENILGRIMTTYENACLKLEEKKKPEKPARLSKAELRRQRIEKSRSQKEADAAAADWRLHRPRRFPQGAGQSRAEEGPGTWRDWHES